MNVLLHLIIKLFALVSIINCYIIEPGPQVIATKGAVWPKPQQQTTSQDYYILRPLTFEFKVIGEDCEILQYAFQRYYDIINTNVNPQSTYKPWKLHKNFVGYLDTINVNLETPCHKNDLPDENMNENYTLKVTQQSGESAITSGSIWGILKGLETFSQLLFPTDDEALQINCTQIVDFPRFSHRGLMVDCSRHFIPIPKLQKILDAMQYNKFNVFHWHITDDQSFPYESIKFPELSSKGAYSKLKIYSPVEVQKIIRYAAIRGIRVMVEFDTPGHTRSWGIAIPELLTACYKKDVPSGQYGPINPINNFTYSFLRDFFQEVVTVFPENFIHLGGDETEYECWESNPDVCQFMSDNNMTQFNQLEDYYIQKLVDIMDDLKSKTIVWEEVFTNGVRLPRSTIVHVWKPNWEITLRNVTSAGYNVLLSSCWYLDHLATGGDWVKYYNCEPYSSFSEDEDDAPSRLILGGEACMWSEVVNEYNIESRIWPRASATAEKLWSARGADTITTAERRLEEHTCRMNKRGIQAQPPTGPGYCL